MKFYWGREIRVEVQVRGKNDESPQVTWASTRAQQIIVNGSLDRVGVTLLTGSSSPRTIKRRLQMSCGNYKIGVSLTAIIPTRARLRFLRWEQEGGSEYVRNTADTFIADIYERFAYQWPADNSVGRHSSTLITGCGRNRFNSRSQVRAGNRYLRSDDSEPVRNVGSGFT